MAARGWRAGVTIAGDRKKVTPRDRPHRRPPSRLPGTRPSLLPASPSSVPRHLSQQQYRDARAPREKHSQARVVRRNSGGPRRRSAERQLQSAPRVGGQASGQDATRAIVPACPPRTASSVPASQCSRRTKPRAARVPAPKARAIVDVHEDVSVLVSPVQDVHHPRPFGERKVQLDYADGGQSGEQNPPPFIMGKGEGLPAICLSRLPARRPPETSMKLYMGPRAARRSDVPGRPAAQQPRPLRRSPQPHVPLDPHAVTLAAGARSGALVADQ